MMTQTRTSPTERINSEPERDAATESSTASAQPDSNGDTVAGERGISSVNRGRSLQARVSNALAIGLMGVLGCGLLAWYYSRAFARQSQAQRSAQSVSLSKTQGEMPLPPLGQLERLTVERPLSSIPPPAGTQGAPVRLASGAYAPARQGAATSKRTPSELALERRLSGPVFSSRSASAPRAAGFSPAVEEIGASIPGSDMGGDALSPGVSARNEMTNLLQPTATPAVNASVLPTQRLLLPKGTFLDCTLETAIDSTLPGMTTCITATDTFSADGSVVLLERGTKLVGETRGQVRQGSARVFVLWTEARTPDGVVVPLASPGTDELGRSGLPGEVNRHFWERFGAAILISTIDGAVQSAVQSSSEGGTVIVNPSTSRDVLTEVLRSTVNIPPTVTKAHGDRIAVLVARDLDFRSVYELRPANVRR